MKQSGVPFWELIKLILALPFMDVESIGSVFDGKSTVDVKAQKDTYYRALTNQKMDWRNLLLLFVKRYLSLDRDFTTPEDDHKCLIFDDTDIGKRGKKIEGLSKTFDHVNHRFIFGFKLLVAGYWNGSVFIPVDFSFHRENKDNKKNKYGLTGKQRKQQKKTKRGKGLPVVKRFRELNSKKTGMLVDMFKRINQRKIEVDYILTDSWFTSISLINKLLKVNKKVHVIGMYKYNSKLSIDGKEHSIKQLRKRKGKMSRQRSLKLYYFQYVGEIDGVKVKVFLSKRGVNGAWHTIITTNTKLSFKKTMEIYSIRWTIEVFFKEAKQLLGLGKCQSTNFDVQVAQTTLTMVRYLLISLRHRMEAYQTIGGIFKDIKQDYLEHKLNERLLLAIVDILEVLDLLVKDIDINSIARRLVLYNESLSFLTYPPDPANNSKLAA
ncbi:transposase [Subsaximicrobium wynnwilliamsii]|uniref:Transposase n=1 Tax=Subsaximicrobium wynnwilliamsii TaxID=291179 RepID=A0A5C6ZFW7_9FLAO|nr:transposase [Subsaximicrobium wynnwilliamsii]TXD82111.1 transposase [Subsaximicrobium wynnwilliamsii]TXD87756.1 transposase [Subsaximicrobium wynnwilliamsii]TXE01567.1 transposase [Subsaximicrobium wynnwilliamsii]